MQSLTDGYMLANGIKIPCIGYGTWQTPEGDIAVRSTLAAIDAGYRHIDTAAAYGNEAGVGKAVRGSGVPREELFITSKLANPNHGYRETLAAFDRTMEQLQLEYLDLYLIHWPNPPKYRDHWQQTNAETWQAFEELYEAGRIRAIGISNFREHHIDALLKTAKVKPMVNQIKLSPGVAQEALVAYSRSKGMVMEAYSPLGVGSIFEVPELITLAEKYGRTIAQVCIRWSLQMGFLPLPKSVTPSRIRENADVFDFELDQEDITFLAGLQGLGGPSDPDTTNF